MDRATLDTATVPLLSADSCDDLESWIQAAGVELEALRITPDHQSYDIAGVRRIIYDLQSNIYAWLSYGDAGPTHNFRDMWKQYVTGTTSDDAQVAIANPQYRQARYMLISSVISTAAKITTYQSQYPWDEFGHSVYNSAQLKRMIQQFDNPETSEQSTLGLICEIIAWHIAPEHTTAWQQCVVREVRSVCEWLQFENARLSHPDTLCFARLNIRNRLQVELDGGKYPQKEPISALLRRHYPRALEQATDCQEYYKRALRNCALEVVERAPGNEDLQVAALTWEFPQQGTSAIAGILESAKRVTASLKLILADLIPASRQLLQQARTDLLRRHAARGDEGIKVIVEAQIADLKRLLIDKLSERGIQQANPLCTHLLQHATIRDMLDPSWRAAVLSHSLEQPNYANIVHEEPNEPYHA